MDRHWLLTSTFYGNWLPGDSRGFVSRVRDVRSEDDLAIARGARHEHDIPGTPYDEDYLGLYESARHRHKGPPVRIDLDQARTLLEQFQETASYRKWLLLAVAVMTNHVHWVVGVSGDSDPTKVLGDFKAYGSRVLNRRWGKPPAGTWWTYAGSKRRLATEQALQDGIVYVRGQPYALVVWPSDPPSERGCVSAPRTEDAPN
jgi:REP element-mobilizing transposase RayT